MWGAFVTGFGLTSLGAGGSDIAPQDVVLLIVAGMLTCLIGVIGLAGVTGGARIAHGNGKLFLAYASVRISQGYMAILVFLRHRRSNH